MKKPVLLMLAAAAFGLAACNGTKKVDYKTFHDDAVAALKQDMPTVTETVINGTYTAGNETYTADKLTINKDTKAFSLKISDTLFISLVSALNGAPATIAEQENTTYYINNGYKVKTETATIKWNKYLMPTSIEGSDENSSYDITVKYTFEK